MPARAKTEPDSQPVGKHRRVAHFSDARSSSGPALCDIAREVVRFRTDEVQSAQGSPNFTQREEPSCDERSISISRRCDRSGRAKHSKTRSCRGRIQARRRALERKPRRRGGQWSSRATARAVAGFLGVTTRAHERRGCRDGGTRAPLPSSRTPQCFGVIFPAKVWVTIFPSFTTKVSVPHGYGCSVIGRGEAGDCVVEPEPVLEVRAILPRRDDLPCCVAALRSGFTVGAGVPIC